MEASSSFVKLLAVTSLFVILLGAGYSYNTFCDSNGADGECIVDQDHQLDQDKYEYTSVFSSEPTALMNSGLDRIIGFNFFNTTFLSGSWQGSFNISSNETTVRPGARFEPLGGRIVIGTTPPSSGPTSYPKTCAEVSGSSGVYKIDPDGGGSSNAFDAYCEMSENGGGWTRLWWTSDQRTGYGFVSCESNKWDPKWSSNPVDDVDPQCDQQIDETIISFNFYDANGNQIPSAQVSALQSQVSTTAYNRRINVFDADSNCDNGRAPVTSYGNAGPEGNSLNVFPTRGDPAADTDYVICGGTGNEVKKAYSAAWRTIMEGGIPTGWGLQSGRDDTGTWYTETSNYDPGYGSTVEFEETYFYVK
jgi:hypothetical protein